MSSGQSILVIEDEPKLARLLKLSLRADGYDVRVAHDGESGFHFLRRKMPDLIILDLILPGGMDGYEFCKMLRGFSDVPVVMLTGCARESEKLQGFECGADDYVTKPFSYPELRARLKAVLHRSVLSQSYAGEIRFSLGDLEIDCSCRRVYLKGKEVRLTPTEYNLLHFLASHPGKVLLHEEILGNIWGCEYRDEYQYLRNYISNLRKKIEEDPSNPCYILSKPGMGYYLSDEQN